MLTREKREQVLWMAECYSLAKRIPNCRTWMTILPIQADRPHELSPFDYWLWMEIWKAAQPEHEQPAPCGKA